MSISLELNATQAPSISGLHLALVRKDREVSEIGERDYHLDNASLCTYISRVALSTAVVCVGVANILWSMPESVRLENSDRVRIAGLPWDVPVAYVISLGVAIGSKILSRMEERRAGVIDQMISRVTEPYSIQMA